MKLTKFVTAFLMIFAVGMYVGCDSTEPDDNTSENENQDDHGHSHEDGDHSHATHAHGPHDGELFEFKDADFRGEITSKKGEDTLTIHILKKDSDDSHPIAAEKIVATQTKGRDAKTFEFMATDADDDGTTSKFVLVENAAVMAYNAFGLKLEVEVDDTTYSADVEKNPHAND